MKKIGICGVPLICAALSLSAQGFYFDVGLSIGKGWTSVNGKDIFHELEETADGGIGEVAVDFGIKAGYGPFGRAPVYVVGEVAGMGHRIFDASDYFQLTSMLIGPGVIFYPMPLIQLGASIGLSYVQNETSLSMEMYESRTGFAWNISAAVDLGRRNHGCLIGIRHFNAINIIEVTKAKENSSMVGIFVKYAYRRKVPIGY